LGCSAWLMGASTGSLRDGPDTATPVPPAPPAPVVPPAAGNWQGGFPGGPGRPHPSYFDSSTSSSSAPSSLAFPTHHELARLKAQLQREQVAAEALRQRLATHPPASSPSAGHPFAPSVIVGGMASAPTTLLAPQTAAAGEPRTETMPVGPSLRQMLADTDGGGGRPQDASVPPPTLHGATVPPPPPLPRERRTKAPGGAATAVAHGPDGMPASEDLAASDDPHPRHRAFAEHCRQLYLKGQLEDFEVLDAASVFLEAENLHSFPGEMEYLVQAADRSRLPGDSVGIVYRFSKQLEDVDASATAVWGVVVSGVDEGDGWLRVGERYLPMEFGGTQVLMPRERSEYLVDNSQLRTNMAGLAYRFSKRLEDTDPREVPAGGPPFGSTVTGVDLGDGWLKVGDRFLPMEIHGSRVLTPADLAGSPLGQSLDGDGGANRGPGGEGAGRSDCPEEMRQELDMLYRELHRRMAGDSDTGNYAGPYGAVVGGPPLPPLPPLAVGPPLVPPPPPASTEPPGMLRASRQDSAGSFTFAPPALHAPPSTTVNL